MRFLFFTDTHIRGITPRSRKDDYYNTVRSKFEEVRSIINENNVDFVLHGGDWFDRPDISPSIVRDFAMIIKSYNRPIYTIAGNHDIYGHNPETLSRTMLGLLEGTDVIKILRQGQPLIVEKDGVKVQLHGNSYTYEIDGEQYEKYYIVKKDNSADFCINIVHGMLLPKPFIEGMKYTLIDNITSTEADITLAGHYHSGFGIKKINGKYFVNSGSLVRVSALKAEVKRIPEVLLIDLNEEIDFKTISLKTALPGDEVFYKEYIEHSENNSQKLYEFLNNILDSEEYNQEKIDLNKIINQIASAEALKDDVKLEAIKRIEQARNSFSDEEVDS